MAEPPKGLEILKATYGAEQHSEDVTKAVKDLIKNGSLSLTVSPQAFGIVDPAPGVKKLLQVNASINGAPPTLFPQEDGKQLVINAPTIKNEEGPKGPADQVSTAIWYSLVALVGTFSSYYFGTYSLHSKILGIILALAFATASITIGSTQSQVGLAGLLMLILMPLGGMLFLVFVISVINPDWIDFSWSKKVIKPAVEAVVAPT